MRNGTESEYGNFGTKLYATRFKVLKLTIKTISLLQSLFSPSCEVFPILTRCFYDSGAPTGDTGKTTFSCINGLNHFYQGK